MLLSLAGFIGAGATLTYYLGMGIWESRGVPSFIRCLGLFKLFRGLNFGVSSLPCRVLPWYIWVLTFLLASIVCYPHSRLACETAN